MVMVKNCMIYLCLRYFTQKARKVIEEVNVNLLRNSKDLRESALKAFVSSIMRHASFGVLGFEQAQPETDPVTGLSYIRQVIIN